MLNIIQNETGTFTLDEEGVLCKFEGIWSDDKYIGSLHIPEGVRVIPKHFFVGYDMSNLTFPDSLVMMGEELEGAFFRCHLDRIVLPRTAWVGKREFAACHIRQVDASKSESPEMMCRFAHALRFSHCYSHDDFSRPWPKAYQDIYSGKSEPKESWTELHNDSGVFWVDSDGFLRDFAVDWQYSVGHRHAKMKTLARLNIPEGVTAFKKHQWAGIRVLEELTLPDSLRYIGSNVFGGSELPDVVLPPHLEVFGDGAFCGSRIRSVTIREEIAKSLLPLHVREFKDFETSDIRVPAKYRDILEEACMHWWEHGLYKIEDVFDKKYGPLCYARAKSEVIHSENIMHALLGRITRMI